MKKLYLFLSLISLLGIFGSYVKGAPAFAGGTGTSTDPYLVSTPAQLSNIRYYSSAYDPVVYKYFKQINDIDLTGYLAPGGAGYALWGTDGWYPIGAETTDSPFNGSYDGNNHVITGLTTKGRNGLSGLFGSFWWDAIVKNLGIESTGSVNGGASENVGGLIGLNAGTVANCFSKVAVNGMGTFNRSGGLVGFNYGIITDSYATGSVSGSSNTGGLVGVCQHTSKITRSYATGSVVGGNSYAGGLVGYDVGSSITDCYARGSVTGKFNIGGILGYGTTSSKITNCYATGVITGTGSTGGLSGILITVLNSYWDKESTGQNTSYASDPSYGKTSAEMKIQSTFFNWNFSSTWKIDGSINDGYPTLRSPYIADIAPSTQASEIVFSAVQDNQITISWTNGNGTKRAVFVKEGTGTIANPSDNITFIASSDWASKGTQLGTTGYYCIYNDFGNQVTLTGLIQSTEYTVQVFEYKDIAGAEKYNTTTATNNPNSQTTTTPCINPTDGGAITEDQTGCTPLDPVLIAGSTFPTGHTGTLEYKWQQSTTSSTTDFLDIPGSNSVSFDPNSITATTWYKRVSRVNCKSDWTGAAESNVVKMSLDPVSIGGSFTEGNSSTIYGSSTGTMSLVGNNGNVVKWQKMLESGSWVDIANTNAIYSENPISAGIWQYRVYVKSGTCTEAHSDPLIITVSPKSVIITGVTAATKVYDGTNMATLNGGTVTTGVDSETLTIIPGIGTFAEKNVGTNAVNATGYALADGTNGGLATNYSLSAQPALAEQSITAKLITITGVVADPKVYDGTNMATLNGGTVTTGVDSETLTIIAGIGTFTDKNVGTNAVNATEYAIADGANGELAANYLLSAQPVVASQEITAKELTVTAINNSKTYGEVNPDLTISYDGFADSESEESLTTAPTATTTASQFSDVDSYAIVPGEGVSTNYTFTYVNGILTVDKAQLDVAANNATRKIGEANPEFTLYYDGFKGTNNASVIDVLPTITCSADASSEAGEYDIVLSGGSDNNYTLVLHDGKLAITSATAINTDREVAVIVYPNPANSYFYIDNIPVKTTIRIYNAQGMLVKTSISSGTSEKIEVSDFPVGLYMVHLTGKGIDTIERVLVH